MPGKRHSREAIRQFFSVARRAGIIPACAEAGVSFQTGRRWLRMGERGAIRMAAAAGPRHDAMVTRLLAMNPDISQADVARELGVSRQRAHVILKRVRNGRAT